MRTLRAARPPDQGRGGHIEVRIERPAAMFTADTDLLRAGARLRTGMEEALQQLRSRRLVRPMSLTVLLPPGQADPAAGDRLAAAIRRYCHLRLREIDLDRRITRRDGIAAFGIGLILFAGGLYLSTALSASSMPSSVRDLLGNGVFLVIAWVGLWYPLDTLVFSGQPLARERRALQVLAAATIEVSADAP